MTKQDIEAIFDRVKTWPLSRQEDAVRMLLLMEQQGLGPYVLSPEEERDLDEAEAGGIASDEEVRAAFARFPGSGR